MRTNIGARGIIIKDDKVLLIHRRKEGKEYWVFPGGGVEEGETPEKAVAREVKEETGVTIKCGKEFAAQDFANGKQKFFDCKVVAEGKLEMGGPEKQTKDNWYQPEWRSLEEIKDLTLYPTEVRDALVKKYESA